MRRPVSEKCGGADCECLAEYNSIITEKDADLEELKHQLHAVTTIDPGLVVDAVESPGLHGIPRQPAIRKACQGKAPPINSFTGENPEARLDDWLPSLERASTCNEWTEDELFL